MLLRVYSRGSLQRARLLAAVCVVLCAGLFVAAAEKNAAGAASDQPAGDTVGLIEGEDIRVTGPMSVEVVGGQTKTILRSGSDVLVKSGQARISLVEGGQISICGPAHFSVLKSGGSLTVALESGSIHALVEREPALTLYTAEIQAQTLAIGDEPREILVGFESPEMMCIHTYRGALRVEQQLSGRSVIVPQGVDVMLQNAQIDAMRNGSGQCKCELQIAKSKTIPAPGIGTTARVGESGSSEAAPHASEATPEAGEKSNKKEEPIYTVIMPPLTFDANAKVQAEPDPRLMLIVRRVRVRPTLVFQGRVEEEAVTTTAATAPQPPVASAPAKTQPPAQGSIVDRVRSFFHRLWS